MGQKWSLLTTHNFINNFLIPCVQDELSNHFALMHQPHVSFDSIQTRYILPSTVNCDLGPINFSLIITCELITVQKQHLLNFYLFTFDDPLTARPRRWLGLVQVIFMKHSSLFMFMMFPSQTHCIMTYIFFAMLMTLSCAYL